MSSRRLTVTIAGPVRPDVLHGTDADTITVSRVVRDIQVTERFERGDDRFVTYTGTITYAGKTLQAQGTGIECRDEIGNAYWSVPAPPRWYDDLSPEDSLECERYEMERVNA